jgi:hypothetical protein
VAIRGSGVAASCCAHLLADAGFAVSRLEGGAPRVPAILIGEGTQALLCDLYGRPDLFDGMFPIERRIVAWGADRPVELPHRAVVVRGDVWLPGLGGAQDSGLPAAAGEWVVYASRPLPANAGEHAFGSRMASATAVGFEPNRESACWIESLDDGWLFLLPDSSTTGWLLAVGASRDRLLERSHLIAGVVRATGAEGGTFAAHPRIADPLCARGWLACGAAAMAFDPISGDGAGAAVREAILAAAVIRAIHQGGDVTRLLAHYRARLIAGLLRHLEMCRTFYASANCGPWWAGEIAALDEGISWCGEALRAAGPFRYRLHGLELQAIE